MKRLLFPIIQLILILVLITADIIAIIVFYGDPVVVTYYIIAPLCLLFLYWGVRILINEIIIIKLLKRKELIEKAQLDIIKKIEACF